MNAALCRCLLQLFTLFLGLLAKWNRLFGLATSASNPPCPIPPTCSPSLWASSLLLADPPNILRRAAVAAAAKVPTPPARRHDNVRFSAVILEEQRWTGKNIPVPPPREGPTPPDAPPPHSSTQLRMTAPTALGLAVAVVASSLPITDDDDDDDEDSGVEDVRTATADTRRRNIIVEDLMMVRTRVDG